MICNSSVSIEPSVTIGIVTYNRCDYLPKALATAFAQGDSVAEILVVDDGSSDGTISYLSSLSNSKLRVIQHEKNGGRPVARNTVVKNMTSEFLLWLDDDDGLAQDAVQSHLNCLAQHPEADVIYCDHVRCDENLNPQEVAPSKVVASGQMLLNLVYENIVPNGGSFIRRDVFNKVGLYFESSDRAYRYEDYEFWARAAVAKCGFVHNSNPLYHFRFHANNLANPEITHDESYHHCLIVQHVLEKANLEDIYTMLPWAEKPQESGATAMTLLARVFFDHGGDQSALECLELSEQFVATPRAMQMKAYVLRAMGKYKEAADLFAQAFVAHEPELVGMNIVVGAARGSKASAERARLERETKV